MEKKGAEREEDREGARREMGVSGWGMVKYCTLKLSEHSLEGSLAVSTTSFALEGRPARCLYRIYVVRFPSGK